jgi:hypothetical protein
MNEIIAEQLEAKCREHAELTEKEIKLSLKTVTTQNAMYRNLWQGQRRATSQKIARVTREIEGLASLLTENNYEPIAA